MARYVYGRIEGKIVDKKRLRAKFFPGALEGNSTELLGGTFSF